MKFKKQLCYLGCVISSVIVFGCQSNQTNTTVSEEVVDETVDQEETTSLFVCESIDESESTLKLKNLDTGEEETFRYTSATSILNKYDEQITISSLDEGSVVGIIYSETEGGDKKLSKVQMPDSYWVYDDVNNFSCDETNQTITVGNQTYKLDTNYVILSNEEEIELSDLDSLDELTLVGTDSVVSSILVTKGHGYVRLSNYSDYLDGWIEIGDNVIKTVEENMIISVPEGESSIKITGDSATATGTVTVERDQEVTVDVSELDQEEVETGVITFTITPSDATLLIDGTSFDYSSSSIELPYGTYHLVVTADGYTAKSLTMVVQSSSAKISIDLEEESDETEDSE